MWKTGILVADDNKINQTVVEAILEEWGIPVRCVENGKDAIQKSLEMKPDLILMDLHMPVMDGLEATREIRNHPELKEIPIIVLTADHMKEDEVQATGASDLLMKPVDDQLLAHMLKQYLSTSVTSENNDELPTLPADHQQRMQELLKELSKLRLIQTEVILDHLNEMQHLHHGYMSQAHHLSHDLEHCVLAGDEDRFKELIQENMIPSPS